MQNLLIGNVTLSGEIACIPTGGLTSRKLRVELSEEKKPDSAWISELEVLGDLPWREGEARKVKVRIMSDQFRQHVENHLPALLVKYGESVIGYLKFDESDKT
jgi:hypothetical protein